jgi:uroporphyrinogen decarboxylase
MPDRPPIDFLAHPEADARLRGHLGAATEAELLDAIEADFFYLPGRDISQNEGFLPCYRGKPLRETESERVCPLGIRWTRGAGAAKFAVDEVLEGPLEKASSPADVLNHPWPRASAFDFSPLRAEAEAHSGRVRIGGLWSGIFGDSYRMVGFQNFLLYMALRPEIIKTLIDRMTDLYLELNERCFTQLAGELDVWFFGNDFGSQGGLLFGLDMWRDFFFDNLRKMTDLAHSHGLRVMMHSCGSIRPLIPHLAEAGVDIIDPVQVAAGDMALEDLKRDSAGRMVLHGGIDTQHVLPMGSPEEVEAHVCETIRILGRDGGYITAPSQLLQPDVPVENMAAMYRAAQSVEAPNT